MGADVLDPPLETLTTNAELQTYGLIFGPCCLVVFWIGSHALADVYTQTLRYIDERNAPRS